MNKDSLSLVMGALVDLAIVAAVAWLGGQSKLPSEAVSAILAGLAMARVAQLKGGGTPPPSATAAVLGVVGSFLSKGA